MASEKWVIDASHSDVSFSVRHMVIAKVRGQFKTFSGQIETDGALEGARVSATIETASVFTNEAKRDDHLRSADFFDAEKNPRITFASTAVKKVSDSEYKLAGDLTIRGVTKPVTLDVEALGRGKDPWGNERLAFHAKTSVDRRDFGLTWNAALEAGGVLVGEKVDLDIEVQLVKG